MQAATVTTGQPTPAKTAIALIAKSGQGRRYVMCAYCKAKAYTEKQLEAMVVLHYTAPINEVHPLQLEKGVEQ